jgi:hypothetical protein
MGFLKQAIGIDVSKDEFVTRYGHIDLDHQISYSKTRSFKNNLNGYRSFEKWARDSICLRWKSW